MDPAAPQNTHLLRSPNDAPSKRGTVCSGSQQPEWTYLYVDRFEKLQAFIPDIFLVWSMPGGFTSNERDGYQTLEDDNPTFVRNPIKPAPVQKLNAVKQSNSAPGGYEVV